LIWAREKRVSEPVSSKKKVLDLVLKHFGFASDKNFVSCESFLFPVSIKKYINLRKDGRRKQLLTAATTVIPRET
jgi:hypothetical protein